MNPFVLFAEYFWLVCIALSVIIFFLLSRDEEGDSTETRELRRKHLIWMWAVSILPWLALGYGQVTGGIRHAWALHRPQDMNPYVTGFYAAVLLVYLVFIFWVFFMDGARIAAQIRLFRFKVHGRWQALGEGWIKFFAAAALPFFAFWLWFMARLDAPVI
jgi:hypothetical protein